MILHGFMIDNVVNVIEGVKNNVDVEILLKWADPLGDFPELKNIWMVDEENYSALYETVLIDLPIGVYFWKLIGDYSADVADVMKEYRPEKIKNLLKKIWITELFKYVHEHLNSTSQEILSNILKFESDCQTIQIIYNTLGEEVYNTQLQKGNNEIDLTKVPSGVYFIKVISNEGTEMKKIIKE